MFDISVVIVSWNTKKLTCECVGSLRECGDDLAMEIIVVDNASSDGTPDVIAAQFPEVVLIRNDRNLGFAAANNIGIRQSHGRLVCLINSDVVVPTDCLPKMIHFMDQHSDIGVLG